MRWILQLSKRLDLSLASVVSLLLLCDDNIKDSEVKSLDLRELREKGYVNGETLTQKALELCGKFSTLADELLESYKAEDTNGNSLINLTLSELKVVYPEKIGFDMETHKKVLEVVMNNDIHVPIKDFVVNRMWIPILKRNREKERKGITDTQLKSVYGKMREMFPAGKQENTGYLWRSAEGICVKKLRKLVGKHPDWTEDMILEATRRYWSAEYDGRMRRIMQYFILKDGNSELEEMIDAGIESGVKERDNRYKSIDMFVF